MESLLITIVIAAIFLFLLKAIIVASGKMLVFVLKVCFTPVKAIIEAEKQRKKAYKLEKARKKTIKNIKQSLKDRSVNKNPVVRCFVNKPYHPEIFETKDWSEYDIPTYKRIKKGGVVIVV